MSLKIAACVILYNPKPEHIHNIQTYLDAVEKIYVFDNTETDTNENLFSEFDKIEYFSTKNNLGLPIHLNEASVKAMADGFDYLLTMDQDSSFEKDTLVEYFNRIETFKNKAEVAVFGLEFSEIEQKNNLNKTPKYIEKKYLITSGSVIHLLNFNVIGGFDNQLFIDGVDIDYCYNALTKNLKNIEFQWIFMKHSLGERVFRASIFSLFLKKKKRLVHSDIRVYYMQRNSLYLLKKYSKTLPNEIQDSFDEYKDHIQRCVKYSKNSFKAFYYKLKGIYDFKRNRMGKINS